MNLRSAFVLLFGVVCAPLMGQAGGGTNGAAAEVLSAGPIDPVSSYGASGDRTSTTGTISAGSRSLTIGNVSGWRVGMGIAVHGAAAEATPELITAVQAISGNVLTLAAPALTPVTNADVHHDDTAAIQAAINAGRAVFLRPGNYNVTSTLLIRSGIPVTGPGAALATIWNRSATNDVFDVRYGQASDPSNQYRQGVVLRDFQIQQDPKITPRSGFGIALKSSGGFHVAGVAMKDLWGGVYVTNSIVGWVSDSHIDTTAGGWGIYYDIGMPGGDMHFDNDELSGVNTGVFVNQSDTTEFTNLKTNGAPVKFGTGRVNNIRFINPSIEGVHPCAFDFGGSGKYDNVLIVGGEYEVAGSAFCHASHVANLTVMGLFDGNGTSHTVTQFPDGVTASTGNGANALALSTNKVGTNTFADFYQDSQRGSTLPIGPTALGAYPANSWAIEGQGGGGIAIGTVANSQPILFAPGRSLAATLSNRFLTLGGGVGLATAGGTAIRPDAVARGSGDLLYSSTLPITAVTGRLGGSALQAGACASWVGPVAGVTTAMVPYAAPQDDPGDGFYWKAYVKTDGQVTVKVCAAVAGTPKASAYVVRVIQ